MKKTVENQPEVKPPKRYVSISDAHSFEIDNTKVRQSINNRDPYVCIHTYRSHDVTPYRKNKFGPKDD